MIFNGTDGNTRTGGLRELRFGDKRIREGYFGNDRIFFQPYVKIMFYFDRTNINPRNRFGTRPPLCGAEWRSTSDPHVWYVITPVYRMGVSDVDYTMGIGQLFCNRSGETGKLLESQVGTCQVTDIIGDVDCITNLDRTFKGCTAITSISQTFWERFRGSTALTNVGGMCANCTGITDGSSLYGYNLLHDTCPNIAAHPDTFVNADSAANRAQIPTSWGGTMAPPATQLSCLKYNNAGWTVDTTDPNCPDFTTVASLNVFTTVSISQYSGVNMKKSNIWNKIAPFVTTTATYYYPAFMQGTGTWPTSGSSRFRPTWVFAPDNYNGMLNASQTTGDMPGILDHEALGPFSTKYGTFDSTKTTYFGFLVFNSDTDLATFDPNSTGYGIHSNSNFKDMTLNWFIPA
jgi:hypothetical protein